MTSIISNQIKKKVRPVHILISSFLVVILLGAALLQSPLASGAGPINFVDALFTSTSATCVTGLAVVDTGTAYSTVGQVIIMLLIQAGGLGIMTLSTFFMLMIFGHFSIFNSEIIQDTLTQKPFKNITNFLKLILLFTLSVEAIGAVLLTIRFNMWMAFPHALYYGVFHSVAAFCNAGFSLFPNSFENYRSDLLINATLMILIISGGLGFIVLLDIKQYVRSRREKIITKLTFHTRIVLIITFFLIIFGAILFYIFEYRNAIEPLSIGSQIIVSLFQSITSRTAGFNTINISILTNSTLLFLMILMFIGASPGSCGGGIKTSTFGVLLAFLISKFRNQDEVNIFNRRVPEEIISRTISITIFSMMTIVIFTLALLMSELGDLSHQESRGLFLEILFEVVSAFGTVGLSTGVTTQLTDTGKILISMLMFIGRLGPLTMALAVAAKGPLKYKYPKENLLVG